MTLAKIAPYIVVSSATAIAGPIDLGSDMLPSMITKPARVPIMPMAGAISPQALKILAPISWRSFIMSLSRLSELLIISPSVPSTSMDTALAIKGLLMSWPSRAIMPSLRAMFASSTICVISSTGSSIFLENALPITPMAPRNSPKEHLAITTAIEPATTINIEAVSTNAGAFSEMAINMRPKAATKPTIVAISMNCSSGEDLDEVCRRLI